MTLCSLSASAGLVVTCENKFQFLLSFDNGSQGLSVKICRVLIWRLRLLAAAVQDVAISACVLLRARNFL